MRPVGHSEAREGRDDRIEPLDTRVEEAWEMYLRTSLYYKERDWYCKRAMEVLMPVRPSVQQLHRFIVGKNIDETHDCLLGFFISAGYQLVPERTIVYDLDTPDLDYLGFQLRGKHLIVTGTVGEWVGSEMIGHLTLNGKAREQFGKYMIGCLGHPDPDAYTKRNLTGTINGQWNNVPLAARAEFLALIENNDRHSHETLIVKINDCVRRYL
jgi:hypothetical protein